MKTLKAYTDIEQSMKLAKFLPLESADMAYIKHSSSDNPNWEFNEDFPPMILGNVPISEMTVEILPCWSLTALLSVLPKGTNISTADSLNKIRYSCWNDYDITYASNPVNACYEMIIKLSELKML